MYFFIKVAVAIVVATSIVAPATASPTANIAAPLQIVSISGSAGSLSE